MESDRIQVFVSYAHEDRRHLEQFRKHTADLRRNKMIAFDDQEIQAGQHWKSMLADKLNTADIVVLLVTAEFVSSEFCYTVEFRRALERKSAGECTIIPVNLGPVDLDQNDPLYAIQHVPQGRSISEIRSGRASSWKQVAQVLRRYVDGRLPQSPRSHPRESTYPNSSSISQPKSSEAISADQPQSSKQPAAAPNEGDPQASSYFYVTADSDELLDSRNSLIECLADSIPDEDYIQQIAEEAGLDRKHLKLVGTPSNRWSSVIRRAEGERKERRIFKRVSRVSPDQALCDAIRRYLRCRT